MQFRARSLVSYLSVALLSAACGGTHAGASRETPSSNGGGASGAGPVTAGTTSSGGLMLGLGGEPSADGGVGGATTTPGKVCDDSCSAVGHCDEGACVVEDNPGTLTPEQQAALRGGGVSDAAFSWLYPYDKTVFPRGLIAPTLQFEGGAADAFYVHVSFTDFDYQGFFGPSDPARIQLPSAVWTALTSAARGTDPVLVEVSKLRGGVVSGPITQSWTIATGSLRGALYYDAGDSIARLRPGEASAQVFLPGHGCVTVSADGSTVVATVNQGNGWGLNTYDLKAGATLLKETTSSDYPGCGALYPDGSLVMLFPAMSTARLVDPKTGASVAQPGWPRMSMTASGSFAPDGSKVTFFEDRSSIALMDFARATTTFENRRDFPTTGVSGIPVFTPDGQSIIYVDNLAAADPRSRLHRLDIETGQVSLLEAINDDQFNYASTILPIAVGGYYWVVFSSDRAYGNSVAAGTQQLWVAALDMSSSAADSSHPAIYLEGGLGRFSSWALDACQSDGSACEFGDQCCGGYCRGTGGERHCLSTPPASSACSAEFEKCASADDCCDPTFRCINNRCATRTPVVK